LKDKRRQIKVFHPFSVFFLIIHYSTHNEKHYRKKTHKIELRLQDEKEMNHSKDAAYQTH